MKNLFYKLNKEVFLATLFIALSFPACQEDEFQISTVQFNESKQHITEGSEATIQIALNRAAAIDGVIQINVESNAIYGQHYTTMPESKDGSIEMAITNGQKTVQLKVKSINNTVFENSKFIILSLENPSRGLRLGNMINYLLTIDDDEGPSLANFALNAGTVKEKDANGIAVQVNLSAPAQGTGSLIISINPGNATYEKDYITSPQATGNSITLDILSNETSKTFVVFPVHNFKVTQSLQLTFTISSVFGVVQKGTSLTYSLTILNEDVESLVNFATNSASLKEDNADGIIIDIPFSAQAPGEGSITISYIGTNASYGTEFTTVPPAAANNTITLFVASNQTGTSFKVLPKNNSYCSTSARSIQWTISLAIGSLKRGSDLDYKLDLIDDEKLTIVSFAANGGSINENDQAGIEVKLNFAEPVNENGTLYINSYCDYYGYDPKFTTNPATHCDFYYAYVPLSISKDNTSTQFKVYPVNNSTKDGAYTWHFNSAWGYNNNCIQLAPDSKYILTIVDDD